MWGQVAKGIKEAATPPAPQVSVTTTKSPEQTQLTVLMDMVKGLQATVTELQRDQADKQTFRSRDDPVRPLQPTCWGCGALGHVRRHFPKGRLPLNTRGSS